MSAAINRDQALMRRFVAGLGETPVDTNPLALDLQARLLAWDPAARRLTLGFRTREHHLQGNGVVQGGIACTMLDFGLAFCALGQLEPPVTAVTASLHVQFEGPVPAGKLQVRATLDRLGGRLAFAGAELTLTGQAQVLVRASATLAILR